MIRDSRFGDSCGSFGAKKRITGIKRTIERFLLKRICRKQRAQKRFQIGGRTLIAQTIEEHLQPQRVLDADPEAFQGQLLE